MPYLERRKQSPYPQRDHDVTLENGWESLYAESPERKTRAGKAHPAPVVSHKAPAPSPLTLAAQETAGQAHAILAEARSRDEDYSLKAATAEELCAMTNAVNKYGKVIAEQTGVDPVKLDIARIQLGDALGEKLRPNKFYEKESIDAATFVITAVALAKMHETTNDSADRVIAGEALDSLREAGDLDRIRQQELLGPHTGELAVAAILDHRFAA